MTLPQSDATPDPQEALPAKPSSPTESGIARTVSLVVAREMKEHVRRMNLLFYEAEGREPSLDESPVVHRLMLLWAGCLETNTFPKWDLGSALD